MTLKVKNIFAGTQKNNPITVKLLRDNLNWKLVLDPELEFPEAYMKNEIIIENASLKEFLMDLVKNLGRREISSTSYLSKKSFSSGDTFQTSIYLVNPEKMLSIIMILVVKKVKNYMIFS